MPTSLTHDQLLALARHGARARLNEIQQEIAEIERLLGSADAGRRMRKAAPRARRRRGWSAAARKAAAERMKAYWAKRKAGRKK